MFDRGALLRQHAGEMLALERQILDALDGQVELEPVRRRPRTQNLIGRAAAVARKHYATLEQYEATVGAEPASPLRRAAESVAATLAGLGARVREDAVSRLLRDDYTALSLAAVSYIVLHTVGLALKDDRLAELSREHLRDLTPIIGEIGAAIPSLVALELAEAERAAAEPAAALPG